MTVSLPSPIPVELAELIAQRLRVIGDPTRIRLLDLLRTGEQTVGQLTHELQTSQQNASKHLGVLHQAGIVSRRKQGTTVLYAIADTTVLELCEQICGGLHAQLAELDALLRGGRRGGPMSARSRSCPAVGVNQGLFVALGDCPMSLVLTRAFHLQRGATR